MVDFWNYGGEDANNVKKSQLSVGSKQEDDR